MAVQSRVRRAPRSARTKAAQAFFWSRERQTTACREATDWQFTGLRSSCAKPPRKNSNANPIFFMDSATLNVEVKRAQPNVKA